jgi:hypothetical protein
VPFLFAFSSTDVQPNKRLIRLEAIHIRSMDAHSEMAATQEPIGS